MNQIIPMIIVIAILAVAAYFVFKDVKELKASKAKLKANQKPGHLHIYRGVAGKSRNIDIIVTDGEYERVVSTNTTKNRDDIVELTKPCTVTMSRAGAIKSKIVVTEEDLKGPIFVKVTPTKYSNNIVKVPASKM